MKKAVFILLAAFAVTMGVYAQEKMIVEKTDGTKNEYNVSEVSRVYFTVPETPSEPGGATAEAVDLGLPSGIKWASCNLGASSPEEYGDYYAWGETEPKADYTWDTYLTSLGATMTSESDCGTAKDPLKDYLKGGSKYNIASVAGQADGIGGTQYDVAHVKLGGSWRMPTKAEIWELLEMCTWQWTTVNGVEGHKVTGSNGNSIFLPAAGYRDGTSLGDAGNDGGYWGSTPYEDNSTDAYYMYFGSDGDYWLSIGWRYYGFSVRPVSE